MSLLSASGLGKHYGAQVCFRDAEFTLVEGIRVGLIGANGTGKTTILKIILGEIEHDGTISRRKNLRIATLDQDPKFPAGISVREAVITAAPAISELERQMEEIHDRLARSPDDTEKLLARLTDLEARFEREGGYAIEHRADRVLEGIGFPKSRHAERVETLSGGERNRLAFARLLLVEPDLWLLDEPTNHLDLDGIAFLEELLLESQASAIIISHDRRFLDDVTSRTWEIEGQRLWVYPAPYSRARLLREERLKSAWREFEKQQGEVERQEQFIRRYQAGQRARQATGRKKRLDRLQRLERPQDRARIMALDLPAGESLGRRALAVRGLEAGYDRRTLFRDLSFEVEAGETLGIVGPNGAGKTTLIRVLLGDLAAAAGEVVWSPRVKHGTLTQHESFPDEETTPQQYIRACQPKRTDQKLRDVLAAMLFRADEIDKPVSILSGGERKRLMLTRLLLEGNNVLILDEPTNHLDLPSRETMELALSAFEGTLIVVSHDRYFLDEIADRVLWIEGGEWRLAASLQEAMQRRRPPISPVVDKSPVVVSVEPPSRPSTPFARLKTPELEEKIIACEERIRETEARFTDPEVFRNPLKLKEVRESITASRNELTLLEAEYAARRS